MKKTILFSVVRAVKIFSLLAMSALLLGSFHTPPDTILITKKEKAYVSIIIDSMASKEIVFAAEELKYYIKKISGAELKIISDNEVPAIKSIYVGKSKSVQSLKISTEKLEKEGFKILFFLK